MKNCEIPYGISPIAWKHIIENSIDNFINSSEEDFITGRDGKLKSSRNWYSIQFSSKQLRDIKDKDLEALFNTIILQRKRFIKKFYCNNAIFYLWHDILGGSLNFSFTTSNKLPFQCNLNFVYSAGDIIKDYLQTPGGYFAIKEFKDVKKNDEDYLIDEDESFLQNVYKCKIQ